jgi:hypothetical protein
MIDPLSRGFCPYRGLAHYDEDYAAFFVGRESDVEVVIANLHAAPLTLLYGESGVGKTSVLMAGVVPRLNAAPGVAIAVFREWQRPDFAAALDAEVRRALRAAAPDAVQPEPGLPFDALLERSASLLGGPLFLVFDQFEEYFLYHAEVQGTTGFEAEFARAVNRRAVDANFLLCPARGGAQPTGSLPRAHPGKDLRAARRPQRRAGAPRARQPLRGRIRMGGWTPPRNAGGGHDEHVLGRRNAPKARGKDPRNQRTTDTGPRTVPHQGRNGGSQGTRYSRGNPHRTDRFPGRAPLAQGI